MFGVFEKGTYGVQYRSRIHALYPPITMSYDSDNTFHETFLQSFAESHQLLRLLYTHLQKCNLANDNFFSSKLNTYIGATKNTIALTVLLLYCITIIRTYVRL